MLKRLNDEDEAGLPGLDTRVKPIIRIINGSLDEDEAGTIILQGRIDPRTLRFLKVDQEYQRPLAARPDIFDALKSGVVVPPIDIGVRGTGFESDGDDYLISHDCYIIDGWQRVGNSLRLLELIPDQPIRIFATVHFGTNDVWERHRFTELNKNVKKVSANLTLRNMRDGNDAVLTLYGLSNNTRDFPLFHKVCWSQNMKRGEMVQAYLLCRVAARLHAHLSPANSASSASKLAGALANTAHRAQLPVFRKNIGTFFDVIDECWGIHSIELKANAPQIKSSFMLQLSRLFSAHIDFWDQGERAFFVAADWRRKLAKFPINDPHVKNLAGSGGGAAGNILYDLLVGHMNSGKRTGHLRSRYERAV